jgi:hypothetical protein
MRPAAIKPTVNFLGDKYHSFDDLTQTEKNHVNASVLGNAIGDPNDFLYLKTSDGEVFARKRKS